MNIDDLEVGKFYIDNGGEEFELVAISRGAFVFLTFDDEVIAYSKYKKSGWLSHLVEKKPLTKLKGYINVYEVAVFQDNRDIVVFYGNETAAKIGADDGILGTIDLSTLTRDNLVGDKTW